MASALSVLALTVGITTFLLFFRQKKVGFGTTFLAIHLLLVGNNFLFISLYADGIFDTFALLDYGFLESATLPIGDGLRPNAYLLMAYSGLLAGAFAASRFIPATPPRAEQVTDWPLLAFTGTAIVIGALAYKVASAFFLPVPAVVFLQNMSQPAGGIAAELDTQEVRAAIPIIFISPVDRIMTVVVLTAGALTTLFAACHLDSRAWKTVGFIFVALVAVLNMAYLKKTPILTIGLWAFLLFALAGWIRLRHIRLVAIAGAGAAVSLTVLAWASLLVREWICELTARFLLGESVEKYLAAEHWGESLPYAGHEFIARYFQSIGGEKQETLGYFWYRTLRPGESEGTSTAQGVILEFFMYYGWVGACLTAFVTGAALMTLDRRLLPKSATLGFYAGALVLTAFISTKGLLSMLLPNGLLALLVLWAIVRILRGENAAARLWRGMIGKPLGLRQSQPSSSAEG